MAMTRLRLHLRQGFGGQEGCGGQANLQQGYKIK